MRLDIDSAFDNMEDNKMNTKGRRRVAIVREMDVVRLVCQVEGEHHAYYREILGHTKGEFQTALRYAIEDGLVNQIGKRRGARLYPTDKASMRMTERPLSFTPQVTRSNADYDEAITLKPKWDTPCSYCEVNEVQNLNVYPINGDIDFDDTLNKATAIRQSFHMCERCYELRMPSHAKFYQDTDWMKRFPEWDGTTAIGEQKVMQFTKWFYAPDEHGETNLYGRFIPLTDNGDAIKDAQEVHVRFTFVKSNDGTTDYKSVQFARGYKYFHKMFGHPNAMWGKKIVVSREAHRNRQGRWFWSWTPYPRIPLHLKRQLELDRAAELDTSYDLSVPEDASLPQHQIHSIHAEGDFTVIKVRRGTDEYKHKFHQLHDALLAFLAGEIGLKDLEQTLQESE